MDWRKRPDADWQRISQTLQENQKGEDRSSSWVERGGRRGSEKETNRRRGRAERNRKIPAQDRAGPGCFGRCK